MLVSPEPTEAMLAEQAEDIPLRVLHEDDTLLIIDKPVGLVVHPGSGNWSGTLLNALLYHGARFRELPRAGIVHRLDKDTSGLLVVAKTQFGMAHAIFNGGDQIAQLAAAIVASPGKLVTQPK